jgi:hypothetical protein
MHLHISNSKYELDKTYPIFIMTDFLHEIHEFCANKLGISRRSNTISNKFEKLNYFFYIFIVKLLRKSYAKLANPTPLQ